MIKVGTTTITEIKKTDLQYEDKTVYCVKQSDIQSSTGTDLLYADLNNNNGNSKWYTTGQYSDKQYFASDVSKYGAIYSNSTNQTLADIGSVMFRLEITNSNWTELGETDYLRFYPAGYFVRLGTIGNEFAIIQVKKYISGNNKFISILFGTSGTSLVTYQIKDEYFDNNHIWLYVYASILVNPKPTTNIPEFSFCVCSGLKQRIAPLTWSLIYPKVNDNTLINSSIVWDNTTNKYGMRIQYETGIQNTAFSISALFNSRDASYYKDGFVLKYGYGGTTEDITMALINPYTNGTADEIPDLNYFNIPTS